MYNKQWCRAGAGLKLLAPVKNFTPEFFVFEMDDDTVISASSLHGVTDYDIKNIIKDIDRIIEEHPEVAKNFKKTTSKLVCPRWRKYNYFINRQGVLDFFSYTNCGDLYEYFMRDVIELMKENLDVVPEFTWGYSRLKTMKWW